ncbi:MAG: MBL fold metallo-hydrolase [Betaproteobacteria bacterium]|nr:MBL fold metallo-hydrolase [Betaproteobacteria bacterium]
MKLKFMGAAREVTGSCYLVQTEGTRFLVDCGMFQGGREATQKNQKAFDFDPRDIEFVLLTHAHIDHSGLLPRLVAQGFEGPIYTTHATAELLAVMLPDSAHIQEKEAEHVNLERRRFRRRLRYETAPLYTVAQAQASLRRLKTVDYGEDVHPQPSIRARFQDAGHILGSAIIELWVTEGGRTTKLVFSGDLGQPGHPIVKDPTPIEAADVLLVESTYGNRLHKGMGETLDELALAVNDTLHRKGGNLIIPSFAVGRTQDILYLLTALIHQGKIRDDFPIYVDSPMAVAATEIVLRHFELLDREGRQLVEWGQATRGRPRIHFVQEVEESIALNDIRGGAVIISASGMCDAGRIKHHLRYNLGRPECSVLFTGFQAVGTLGRRIVEGAKVVRIFREEIPVRADIYTVGGLSAHADQAALLGWLKQFAAPPRQTFVIHGEEGTAMAFADKVRTDLGWKVEVPVREAEYGI